MPTNRVMSDALISAALAALKNGDSIEMATVEKAPTQYKEEVPEGMNRKERRAHEAAMRRKEKRERKRI